MQIKIEVTANESEAARDELETILSLVAGNPDTPQNILKALSEKHSERIQQEVAANPHTDLETLQRLLDDECPQVRGAVAQHPGAINFTWRLVKDQSALVRYALATNKNLPEHVYQYLLKDSHPRVARRAKRTMQMIKQEDSFVGHVLKMFAA